MVMVTIMTSLFYHPFPINSQYLKISGVDSHGIHLIEKTLWLEKYKPWMMGPNGFMGRTLLALQVLFRNVYFIKAFGDDASKKYQTVSRSHGKKLTASPVLDT